jgi:predicted nucleotidyltransferase
LETTLLQKRIDYTNHLRSALRRILKKLQAKPEVMKVILIGSYASGRSDLFTDLDLVVVMDSEKDFVTRKAELYPELHAGVDLDLLVYTPDEFDRMKTQRFLRHALKTGKVLYEK